MCRAGNFGGFGRIASFGECRRDTATKSGRFAWFWQICRFQANTVDLIASNDKPEIKPGGSGRCWERVLTGEAYLEFAHIIASKLVVLDRITVDWDERLQKLAERVHAIFNGRFASKLWSDLIWGKAATAGSERFEHLQPLIWLPETGLIKRHVPFEPSDLDPKESLNNNLYKTE